MNKHTLMLVFLMNIIYDILRTSFVLFVIYPYFAFGVFLMDCNFISDMTYCINTRYDVCLVVFGGFIIFLTILLADKLESGEYLNILITIFMSFTLKSIVTLVTWNEVQLKDDHPDCNMKSYYIWTTRIEIDSIIIIILYVYLILIGCALMCHYRLPTYLKTHKKYKYHDDEEVIT